MKKNVKSMLAGSLLIGAMALGVVTTNSSVAVAQPTFLAENVAQQREHQVKKELGTFAKLAKELNPSVVNISVVKSSAVGRIPQELLPHFRGRSPGEVSGQGSGVIISADGDVLTNNHVVEGASEIKVKLFDGRELDAEVIGTDSNTDLALLKLKDASDLPVARMGDSDELDVGDWVMAIGNPFGLEATVTVGVLSGKGRVIGAGPYDDFLQTDTSINPGNSGGPLFNLAGEVVGINTAIIRQGQGIGFSIPINLAKDVSRQLKATGQVQRGFIGVGIQPLTPALKSALSIPKETSGALVASVLAQGPAEAAGVKVSDIITAVDGNPITSDKELLREVAKLPAGVTVPLQLLRDGKVKTVRLTISERPGEEVVSQRPVENPAKQLRVGVAVADPADGSKGAVVMRVIPGSAAAKVGLRRGDLIRSVGKKSVQNAREFTEAVERAERGSLAFLVERDGRTSYVVVED